MKGFRQLLKQPHVHVNIGGLAIGLCAGLFIALIVRTELQYDRFLPDYERVYRVSSIGHPPGRGPLPNDTLAAHVAGWLKTDFSESFEAVGRLITAQHGVKHGDVEAMERIDWADPDLTRVLSFPTIAGEIRGALDQPDGLVLDREMALKYFGRTHIVGESLEIDRQFPMRIAAVMENLTDSSHLDTHILASSRSSHSASRPLDEAVPLSNAMPFHTYVKLRAGVDPEQVRRALPAALQRNSLYGLSAFATERRTREVGIRKALGAGRSEIVRYFLWLFTKPVLWSAVVALPVTWVLMRRWLDGFAYRIELDAYTFLAAVLITWLVACGTVLTHVVRAARARPVEALRYE